MATAAYLRATWRFSAIAVAMQGRVGIVGLGCPIRNPAARGDVNAELRIALARFDIDPALDAVVLAGGGAAFSCAASEGARAALAAAGKTIVVAVDGVVSADAYELMSDRIIVAALSTRFARSSRMVDAPRAARLGLVARIAPDHRLLEAALAAARAAGGQPVWAWRGPVPRGERWPDRAERPFREE